MTASIFIPSLYYPNNGPFVTTGPDEGYAWIPDIGFGWYLFKKWGIRYSSSSGGWYYYLESEPYLVRSLDGGPFLPDPYEPTKPLPEPIPEPPVTFAALAIYVNGTSMPVIESMMDLTNKNTGIDAPLIIGPI